MFKALIFTCIVLMSACAYADEPAPSSVDFPIPSSVNFNGAWRNDMGSELVFEIKDGMVSGRYNTNVGEPDKNKSFPIVGQADGDQIVFTVNFKGYSMTAWVGQVTLDKANKPYLRTLWHNTKDIEDAKERDDIWGSIRAGASDFRQVK